MAVVRIEKKGLGGSSGVLKRGIIASREEERVTRARYEEDAGPMLYYHITPKRNLSVILKEGLRVYRRPFMATSQEQQRSKRIVSLAMHKSDIDEQFGLQMKLDPKFRFPNMVLLTLDLPEAWPIQGRNSDELYTNKNIPSEYIVDWKSYNWWYFYKREQPDKLVPRLSKKILEAQTAHRLVPRHHFANMTSKDKPATYSQEEWDKELKYSQEYEAVENILRQQGLVPTHELVNKIMRGNRRGVEGV